VKEEDFMKEYELAGIEAIARGVAIVDGSILVCRAKGGKSSYLPGGHIEFGESAREALVREIREELGVESETGRFLGAVENSFMQHGKPHAEINLVFELAFAVKPEAAAKEDWIEFEWVRLEELEKANLLPSVFNALASGPGVFFAP
jgi:8-oxo-dGTP pyrophosphatase MutT (NUDIX family)